jgi:hypothetical protein
MAPQEGLGGAGLWRCDRVRSNGTTRCGAEPSAPDFPTRQRRTTGGRMTDRRRWRCRPPPSRVSACARAGISVAGGALEPCRVRGDVVEREHVAAGCLQRFDAIFSLGVLEVIGLKC